MLKKTPRLDSLTSLRYLAALVVVVTHVNPLYLTSHPLRVMTAYGYAGVSFFFVLSGFVLTWLCSRQPAGRFWWNRFSRIWPMQMIMMIIAYVFFWDVVPHPPGPVGWVLQPFLLHGWDPDPRVHAGGDGPVWSLSCEMFFYLMFPLFVAVVRRLRARGLVISGAATITLMTVIPVVVGPHVSPAMYYWLFFYMPGYRFGEFFIGMLLGRAVMLGLRFRYPSVGYLLAWAGLAVWAVGITQYTIANHGHPVPRPFVALLAIPCFVILLVAGASADLTGRSRLMSRWLPVKLGEWSFALYLVHGLLNAVVEKHHLLANSGGLTGFAYMMFFIAVATVVAAIAHYTIEKPAERWLRQRMPGGQRGAGPRHRKDPAEHAMARS